MGNDHNLVRTSNKYYAYCLTTIAISQHYDSGVVNIKHLSKYYD